MRIAQALQVRGHAIAEFFVSEVLEQQPPEVAQFMLDTSILGELTADTCAAVTGRPDAAALLHAIGTAHLFLAALDAEGTGGTDGFGDLLVLGHQDARGDLDEVDV
jgi:ATP/maltotriose-dependent transcriptional regulator MalT